MSSSFPVQLDPDAIPILKRMVEKSASSVAAVRLGVKGGGCSGFEYVIRLETTPRADDLRCEVEGIALIIDPKSAEFLKGATLVATGNLIGGGLAFKNPNAQRSCGCGSSFVPKEDG